MCTEIPGCQRCCMHLPLRFGLIVWGYIRLLLAGSILIGISCVLHQHIHPSKPYEEKFVYKTPGIVVLSLIILVVIPDIILGIVFVIGCRKNDARLIKKYYYHNAFLLTLTVPLGIYNFGRILNELLIYDVPFLYMMMYLIITAIISLIYIVIQKYVVLLIKNEILKLNGDLQFSIQYNTAEATCSMNIENQN